MWKHLKKLDLSYNQDYLCGTDEAGRGPIAGPVTAAAVVLNYKIPIEELNDSKKLSEKKRNLCFQKIIYTALDWAVCSICSSEIDRVNILNASLEAMKRAVSSLCLPCNLVLVDGNRQIPHMAIEQRTIVKGDSKSAAIAAASILAKCCRDKIMLDYHQQFPQYLFHQHKEYPTKKHMELLNKYGPTPIHRFSFEPLRSMNQLTLF